MRTESSFGFRTDINGLRAWAVVLVMLFHFGVPGFQGGFVGVDVFFVISGYLMTCIILGGLGPAADKPFSLAGFYRSRAARIVPALLFLCMALLVVGWFILLPVQFAQMSHHASGAALFYSNVLFWQQAGYFAPSSHENWLLHTWSLSVEWQFYLIYPLVLLAWSWLDRRKRHLAGVVWVLFGVSLLYSVWATPNTPSATFYLLPARMWEMLAGALVYIHAAKIPRHYAWNDKLEWLGFGFVIVAATLLTGESGWPGYQGVVPVAGTALILLANRNSRLTGSVIAQWIGLRSYSIYLWHWPLVVALSLYGQANNPLWLVTAFLLSFVLGDFSFRVIEQWPRQWLSKARPVKAFGLVAGVAVVMLGLASQAVQVRLQSVQDGEAARSEWLAAYTSESYYARLAQPYREECNFYDNSNREAKTQIDDACTAGEGGGVFLWGDSHAQALAHGLQAVLHEKAPGLELYQVATSACVPDITGRQDEDTAFKLACSRANRHATTQIQRLRPYLVIMAQAAGHDKAGYQAIAHWLRQQGVEHVVLVGPVPQWRPSLPQVIAERHWDTPEWIVDPALDQSIMRLEERLMVQQKNWVSLQYVSLIGRLCEYERCLGMLPEQRSPLAFDYGHLTLEGSLYVAQNILGPELAPLFEGLPRQSR